MIEKKYDKNCDVLLNYQYRLNKSNFSSEKFN